MNIHSSLVTSLLVSLLIFLVGLRKQENREKIHLYKHAKTNMLKFFFLYLENSYLHNFCQGTHSAVFFFLLSWTDTFYIGNYWDTMSFSSDRWVLFTLLFVIYSVEELQSIVIIWNLWIFFWYSFEECFRRYLKAFCPYFIQGFFPQPLFIYGSME